MSTYHLQHAAFKDLLSRSGGELSFISAGPSNRVLQGEEVVSSALEDLSIARSPQSPKGFLLPGATSVGRYGPKAAPATAVATQPVVVLGLRACELRAQRYLDQAMLGGDFEDPIYRARREATTFVTCDCVDCADSCFCVLVGGRPFATEGYDVNLTPMDGGWLIDVGTEKGREWLESVGGDGDELPEADAEQLAGRDEIRQGVIRRLGEQNAEFGFSATDEAQPTLPQESDDAWQQFAADCVECGACTNACPTCYCFYLYDQVLGPEEFERLRTWDSCLLSTYHRMAGGASMKLTPRPRLHSRLANRVLHKFTYSSQQYGLLGCVGCGRCVDGCLGAIDIRQVVKELGQ